MALVLLHSGPHLVVGFDLDRFRGVELLEATEIHRLLEEWQDVFVKGLPVSVSVLIPIIMVESVRCRVLMSIDPGRRGALY